MRMKNKTTNRIRNANANTFHSNINPTNAIVTLKRTFLPVTLLYRCVVVSQRKGKKIQFADLICIFSGKRRTTKDLSYARLTLSHIATKLN